jgi:DNA-binding protein HU-beta
MNKEELAKEVAQKTGLAHGKAVKAVESFFLAIEDALVDNQKVTIAGFGTFELTLHKERKVINPKTKQLMTVPALTTARFRPSRILRQKVR